MKEGNEKLLITFIWGIAIGSLVIFIDTFFVYFQPASVAALFIIGLFSYAYLRSMVLGILCGAISTIPIFIYLLFQIPESVSINITGLIIGFIISAVFYSAPGAIGGCLAEKKLAHSTYSK